jgi:hypothetical protein
MTDARSVLPSLSGDLGRLDESQRHDDARLIGGELRFHLLQLAGRLRDQLLGRFPLRALFGQGRFGAVVFRVPLRIPLLVLVAEGFGDSVLRVEDGQRHTEGME